MRRIHCMLAIAVLLCATGAQAQDPSAGQPGSFLRFGASARSLAMGGAATGLADDAAALYVNPAGLEQVRGAELLFFHAELYADTRQDFFGLVQPMGELGTLGLAGVLLSSGGYERATAFEDLDQTFSESQTSLQISFARRVGAMSVAATYRNVNQNLAEYSASGSGLDLSAFIRPHRNISVGLNVQNVVAPKLTMFEATESYPLTLRAGGALRLMNGRLISTADLMRVGDAPLGVQTGVEMWGLRSFALRTGWDALRGGYAAGGGYRHGPFQLDYAFSETPMGNSHRMSFTWRFGVPNGVSLSPDTQRFSPSGDRNKVDLKLASQFRGRPKRWELSIHGPDGALRHSANGVKAPPEIYSWDGRDDAGRMVPTGDYQVKVVVYDEFEDPWMQTTTVEIRDYDPELKVPVRMEVN